ncbi:MAG: hypothetical protein AAGK17_09495 [Pseudomonadota bacterium]
MALATTPQQGLDTVPRAVFSEFEDLFTEFLPNWRPSGEYNLTVGVTTMELAVQFDLPVQNGSHPWINSQMRTVLNQIKNGDPAKKARITVTVH